MSVRGFSRAAGLSLTAVLLFCGAGRARADQASDFAKAVFDATNAVRIQRGLYPLAPDTRLTAAALAHSQLMNSEGVEAHQLTGEADPGGRLDAVGYHWTDQRENLAQWPITETADALVQDWLQVDAAHRDNILATDVWDMGIGVVIGPFDQQHPDVLTYWVTQDTGREGDANFNLHLGKLQ